MIRILLVEDDTNLGLLLKENLDKKGYETVWINNSKTALTVFHKQTFGLCILDVMMPVKDGFALAQEIRRSDKDVPIIFLTARSMQEDKIHGFEIGGDDYITKPFSAQELHLRIEAILRRSGQARQLAVRQETVRIGNYSFDYHRMLLRHEGTDRKLSLKEAALLHVLVTYTESFVPRADILKSVWGNDDYFAAKSMDVYISRLRRLLKSDPRIEILNAYGIGYKLVVH